MASVDGVHQSEGPPHVVIITPSTSSDVIAVERASPEVFHVVSAPRGAGGNPDVSGGPAATTMALPAGLSATGGGGGGGGNVQTITISAGNLTFPVTIGGQSMVRQGLCVLP